MLLIKLRYWHTFNLYVFYSMFLNKPFRIFCSRRKYCKCSLRAMFFYLFILLLSAKP